jgi:hypothetical protein
VKTYLGIGVNEGGCVRTVVTAIPEIDLTLCDTWGTIHGGRGRGNHNHIVELLEKAGHRGNVRFLDGPSQGAERAAGDLFGGRREHLRDRNAPTRDEQRPTGHAHALERRQAGGLEARYRNRLHGASVPWSLFMVRPVRGFVARA